MSFFFFFFFQGAERHYSLSSFSAPQKNPLKKRGVFFFAPTQKRARAQKRGLALFGEEEELPGDPRPAAFLSSSSSSSSFGFSFPTKEENAGSERARFFALTERDSIICSSTCRRKEDGARRWKDHHLSKETVKVIRTNYGKS